MTPVVRTVIGAALALVPAALTGMWIGSAKARLGEAESEAAEQDTPAVAIAAAADEGYCNADLKKVLRRVLLSCGLAGGEGRGCQPADAKNVATMEGEDFNALFLPLSERASIIQFDKNKAELDAKDLALLDKTFADQRGASWFFVVSRASPEGSVEINREISQKRAEAVMDHLRQTFNDPDLEREVGLLWLGEEFAQLDDKFCAWHRSGEPNECEPEHLNRSAFVAWIDCRL
jgi:outer membrane protein OmpA-like peptidoglycan-associated protein